MTKMCAQRQTWRQYYAPIIYEVVERTKALGEKAVKKALVEAHKGLCGKGWSWPDSVWYSERRRQLERAFQHPDGCGEMPLFEGFEDE